MRFAREWLPNNSYRCCIHGWQLLLLWFCQVPEVVEDCGVLHAASQFGPWMEHDDAPLWCTFK